MKRQALIDKSLIDWVLSMPELDEEPPVLVDIGASSAIHPTWEPIACRSVCLAFDPDRRDMVNTENTEGYRVLRVLSQLVSDEDKEDREFFLTRSPYCSSALRPDAAALADWSFADLFEIEHCTAVPAITLSAALTKSELSRVDWFKTDSQGTDLRLFLSLPEDIRRRVLVAEFEPGIIDCYIGEDKLHDVMRAMDVEGFWMVAIDILGSHRIQRRLMKQFPGARPNWFEAVLPTTPGWAEVTYFNRAVGRCDPIFGKRDLLLAWLLASLWDQHGFALEIAVGAAERFADGRFNVLSKISRERILPTGKKKMWHFAKRLGRRLCRLVR